MRGTGGRTGGHRTLEGAHRVKCRELCYLQALGAVPVGRLEEWGLLERGLYQVCPRWGRLDYTTKAGGKLPLESGGELSGRAVMFVISGGRGAGGQDGPRWVFRGVF